MSAFNASSCGADQQQAGCISRVDAVMTGSVRQAMARVRKTPKYRHLVKRLQAEQAASGKNGAAPARKRPSAKPKKARLGGGDRQRLARRGSQGLPA